MIAEYVITCCNKASFSCPFLHVADTLRDAGQRANNNEETHIHLPPPAGVSDLTPTDSFASSRTESDISPTAEMADDATQKKKQNDSKTMAEQNKSPTHTITSNQVCYPRA
jgi:hypothetical protein